MRVITCLFLVCLPLRHFRINSGFGYRVQPLTGKYCMHNGVDLKARHDTVFAVLSGYVKSIGYSTVLGINLRLSHNCLETIYGHLSEVLVDPGEPVGAGEPIAITGATGRVTGEHLHFSIRYRNSYIDPTEFFYQLLIKNEHERQQFQSTPGTAVK